MCNLGVDIHTYKYFKGKKANVFVNSSNGTFFGSLCSNQDESVVE